MKLGRLYPCVLSRPSRHARTVSKDVIRVAEGRWLRTNGATFGDVNHSANLGPQFLLQEQRAIDTHRSS